MGTVYLAMQDEPRRHVALKVMKRGVASRRRCTLRLTAVIIRGRRGGGPQHHDSVKEMASTFCSVLV